MNSLWSLVSTPRYLFSLGLLGALALSAHASAKPAPRPNIVFILVDDLGYGDVGVFGQNARAAAGRPAFATPQLDRLAGDGVKLTHHYCAAPVCAPSRASLLLGVSQGHAALRNNEFDKALEENHTLASVLRTAGYATAAFGKWGLQGDDAGGWSAPPPKRPTVGDPSVWRGYPTKRGFDFFHGYVRHADGHYHYPKEDKIQLWENEREISADAAGSYTTDLFTARAKRWIVDHRQANADQPFFLFLAYDTPHAKLQRLPGPYPDGGGLKGGVQWTGQPGALLNTSATAKPDTWLYPEHTEAKYDHDQDPATPAVPWPEVYQRYASSVKRIDECVGDLRLLLRDLGIERDTLVVFTSDNGPAAESYLKENFSPEFFGGFGPFDGLKRDLLEGGWRVPTFAAWPAAITAGRELTQPSAHSDWMPTLSALAGVPAPARTDGMALSELWGEASDAAPTPRTIYSEFKVNGRTPPYASFETARRGRTRGQMQALRVGDFVGVRYDVKSADAPFEIFDATKDPKQLRDLAKDPAHASLQAEFQARALQSRRPYPANPTVWDALPVPGVEVPAGAARELSWARYLGEFPWVPETRGLSPSALGTTERFTGAQLGETSGAMKFTGYLVVPTEGDYTFTVAAPGGAVLRLHETTVIDADFGYVAGEERSGAIRLAAGHHPFTLTVRRDHKSTGDLSVTWAGPELSRRALTATDFAR